MLRLTEILLFLSPFAAAAAWWWLGRRDDAVAPAPSVLLVTLAALVLLGSCLVWFGIARRLDKGGIYVPAQLIAGQIIAGHTAPR